VRTLVASAEEPPRRPVSGFGWTYSGPGFTISWPATCGATSTTLDWRRLNIKTTTD
jgi:hypothetical protein